MKMSIDEKSTHYDAGGIEVFEIIKAKLTPEQYEGWLLGNAIKYSCRLNFKGQQGRDAEKLANYSKRLADAPSTKPTDPLSGHPDFGSFLLPAKVRDLLEKAGADRTQIVIEYIRDHLRATNGSRESDEKLRYSIAMDVLSELESMVNKEK